MAETINEIISRTPAGGTAVLPAGEFEGPVYITKPLRLVGNNTTLWAKRGSVIEITCAGASLEGLRVELTEGDLSEAAIVAHKPASVKDVELLGQCSGFGKEDSGFDFPRTLNLGSFAAEQTNTYLIKVYVPTDSEIVCSTAGLSFAPKVLTAGMNNVTVTVSGFNAMNYLYSEVLVRSVFTRRIYVSGRPSPNGEQANGKLLYEAHEPSPATAEAPAPAPQAAPPTDVVCVSTAAPLEELPMLDMRKGQRVSLYQYVGSKCELRFDGSIPAGMEIDPYIFLLDIDEKCPNESSMVFFGNESSNNGGVRYFPDDGHIEIDFEKLDYNVQRIAVAYSIYDGNSVNSFSKVGSPRMTVSAAGTNKLTYCMYGLNDEVTIVAMEIYLYKGEWKICAVGRGYRDGLVKLCNNYGIEVTD